MIHALISSIRTLGKNTLGMINRLGKAGLFLIPSILGMLKVLRRPRLIIAQLYSVGVLSMVIIIVAGFSSAWCWAYKATFSWPPSKRNQA